MTKPGKISYFHERMKQNFQVSKEEGAERKGAEGKWHYLKAAAGRMSPQALFHPYLQSSIIIL